MLSWESRRVLELLVVVFLEVPAAAQALRSLDRTDLSRAGARGAAVMMEVLRLAKRAREHAAERALGVCAVLAWMRPVDGGDDARAILCARGLRCESLFELADAGFHQPAPLRRASGPHPTR
jgi:hypothetical protein